MKVPLALALITFSFLMVAHEAASEQANTSETVESVNSRPADKNNDLVKTTLLANAWEVDAEGTGELSFELDNFAGKQVRLRLDGRIDWRELIGNTGAMTITVNGEPLVSRRLMNKPLSFTMREGTTLEWAERNGNVYRLMYAPDFSDRLKTDNGVLYGLPEAGQDPFHFMWDITPFVVPGKNKITISSPSGMELALKFRDVAIELGDPIPYKDPSGGEKEAVMPAPTGPLPVYVPRPLPKVPLVVEISSSGDIRFQAAGRAFSLQSRSSLPDGKWTAGGGAQASWNSLQAGKSQTIKWIGSGYDIERKVTLLPDRVAFIDTVRNTGNDLAGVMIENRLLLPEKAEKTLLGGRETAWVTEARNAFHPTILAAWDGLAVGMVAENDLFRLHNTVQREDKAIILADRGLGVPVGKSRVLEWSLYVIPDGDYWGFVNAIRRDWGSNFPLRGPVTFTGTPDEWGQSWDKGALTTEVLKKWLTKRNNALPMVMTHVPTDPNVGPDKATKENLYWYHGTAIPKATHWLNNTRALVSLMKEVAPEVQVFAYIHPNLSTEVGYEQKYRDSVALERDGAVARSVYKPEPGLFIPTLENSYGAALAEVYRQHIDDLGANLYIDEITVAIPPEAPYSQWDESTVVIDLQSHLVVGKISNATLLMQPWLDTMISYAKSKGKTAFANTVPSTRTMLDWHIQHITEDTGPAGITSTHLSTPLAWTYDTGELSGYQHIRESLSHGGISFSRSGGWSDHMFPITPIELRSGVIIGKERILTIRSGRFGWADGSGTDVLVYDGAGHLVERPEVREIREGDQVFTELRMPSDHFAILIRKPAN